MKSFFLVSFLSFCLCGVEAKDHIDPKSNNLDLEELIRNHSGEIEELKHRIKIIEQSLGISHSEKVVLKDSKQIANKIKKKTPEEIIEMAKDLISLDRCQEARDILNAFISEHPQNLYCGRMYFYIGKSYFEERDYQSAAKAYMESFEINPKGAKTPKALFKLSQCFFKLGKQDQKKITLEKLASTFPQFKHGKKAIALLKKQRIS